MPSASAVPPASMRFHRGIVPAVIQQHVDDAVILHATRTRLVAAPHVKLEHLQRFDNRLAAHLDGLAIAGELAGPFCSEALQVPSAGAVFAASVQALLSRQQEQLERLLALVEAVPEIQAGLLGAFGWLDRTQLQGVVAGLLAEQSPFRRMVGIAACAMHRVDPGLSTMRHIESPDPLVRARALRTAGEIGQSDQLEALSTGRIDPDPQCQFWAAWSAVILGDRRRALDFLQQVAIEAGPLQSRAFQLVLQALPVADAHALLSRGSRDASQQRRLIQGAAYIGDPTYVPWLISLMSNDALARAAGESFSFITGADLAALDLERDPPAGIEVGPNDDPADENVELDPDEDLPWPDLERVQSYWHTEGGRLTAGVRHLVGAPVTTDHCLALLTSAYQRHRIAAALHLSLLDPGKILFEWRAPSWRQQRTLALC